MQLTLFCTGGSISTNPTCTDSRLEGNAPATGGGCFFMSLAALQPEREDARLVCEMSCALREDVFLPGFRVR